MKHLVGMDMTHRNNQSVYKTVALLAVPNVEDNFRLIWGYRTVGDELRECKSTIR